MKEATGELNMTVVVVISVGVLTTFFFTYLWPIIRNNFEQNASCSDATCDCSEEIRNSNDGKCVCSINNGEEFLCVYKG